MMCYVGQLKSVTDPDQDYITSLISAAVPGPRLTLDRTIPCVSPSTGCRGKCMMLFIIDSAHSSKAGTYAKLEYAGHSNNAVFMLNLWYLIMMASICVHLLLEISSSTTRQPQNNQIFKMWPLSVQNKDVLLQDCRHIYVTQRLLL